MVDVAGDLLSRTLDHGIAPGATADGRGWHIENFGLAENLMIAFSAVPVHSTAEQAIAACAAAFAKDRK